MSQTIKAPKETKHHDDDYWIESTYGFSKSINKLKPGKSSPNRAQPHATPTIHPRKPLVCQNSSYLMTIKPQTTIATKTRWILPKISTGTDDYRILVANKIARDLASSSSHEAALRIPLSLSLSLKERELLDIIWDRTTVNGPGSIYPK